jgi:UDP-N-acetylmuramoylalanine--D-glutamate ligase
MNSPSLQKGLLPERVEAAPIPLAGIRVAVFGMKRSGLAVADFLARRDAVVTVLDEANPDKLAKSLSTLSALPVKAVAEAESYEQFGAPQLVVTSPAVPYDHPFLSAARADDVPVIAEIELAWRFCEVPMLAVTGTNGKGTVVTLVADMLKRGGIRAQVAGNIGIPLISLANITDTLDVVVAEISSFQLENTRLFRPWLGMLLNVSPDHCDRHPDMAQYVSTKSRIFGHQHDCDLAVLNMDDRRVAKLAPELRGTVLGVSLHSQSTAGRIIDGDLVVQPPMAVPVRICSRKDLPFRGDHNVANALCASLAAAACGISADTMLETLQNYERPPHLLQLAGKVDGVTFIDDSKATNPAAAIADLNEIEGPLILIAGGLSKGANLSDFAMAAAERAKHLVLIGESAAEIAAAVANRTAHGTAITMAESLAAAVRTAFDLASPGDTVILAPGGASFDMFEDMAQRGEVFCQAVRDLAHRN